MAIRALTNDPQQFTTRLRSPPAQRSAAFVLDNPAIIRQLFVMKRLEPPHRFSPP
jgi:hypothetical protein